jgi:hypothetical protein
VVSSTTAVPIEAARACWDCEFREVTWRVVWWHERGDTYDLRVCDECLTDWVQDNILGDPDGPVTMLEARRV